MRLLMRRRAALCAAAVLALLAGAYAGMTLIETLSAPVGAPGALSTPGGGRGRVGWPPAAASGGTSDAGDGRRHAARLRRRCDARRLRGCDPAPRRWIVDGRALSVARGACRELLALPHDGRRGAAWNHRRAAWLAQARQAA